MLSSKLTPILLSLGVAVVAQRPSDTPICDYYTTALLKENNATNQYTLLTLLVNTVVIGNYTMPNVGVMVPGILAKGTYEGNEVNLLPYFDGTLESSNRGGDSGVSVNFLDDGGAAPLMENKPAATESSNQYMLLTHLYQFFGALLGCTMYGSDGFPKYGGDTRMAEVHRFMRLDENELGYFITQVGLAASSFGVATEDVQAVGGALTMLFAKRCAPAAAPLPEQEPELESICLADTCPLADNPTCAAYPSSPEPMTASAAMDTPTETGSMTMAPSASQSTTVFPGAAGKSEVQLSTLFTFVVGAGLTLGAALIL